MSRDIDQRRWSLASRDIDLTNAANVKVVCSIRPELPRRYECSNAKQSIYGYYVNICVCRKTTASEAQIELGLLHRQNSNWSID